MSKKVRVRFAPSPTGGLHLGGVRTVLYNYLFAKHNNGDFILRIEDTDRTRYVEGAEQYIYNCLDWCGLAPDESPENPGEYGPYRQSERKDIYKEYAEQLIAQGNAYYAFDTKEELEEMRTKYKTAEHTNPQYDGKTRDKMRNSLSMPGDEVQQLLDNGTPHVVRIKMPANETTTFTDMIRGEVSNDTNLVDDKVLLKADGMPTYHLAVVVDDYLMKISHAFRGEEWLPSAPVHILLWKYLGWEADMPQWGHLPLILKPDGNGKLSKRDGQRLGFPVFALQWKDPATNDVFDGFKEQGFLPEAFINILAMLGWNDTTEQELFTLNELVDKFTIDRVHKGGAKFDYEKAKWYNHQYLVKKTDKELVALVMPFIRRQGVETDELYLGQVIALVKERCQLLTDFWAQSHFFFKTPEEIDTAAIQAKWTDEAKAFFTEWLDKINTLEDWTAANLEETFNTVLANHNVKKGAVMLPLRVMLVGGKYGPGVFDIAHMIGKDEIRLRVDSCIMRM